jgi:hypothetical protein
MAYAVLAQGLPYRFFLGGIVIGGFALSLQVSPTPPPHAPVTG